MVKAGKSGARTVVKMIRPEQPDYSVFYTHLAFNNRLSVFYHTCEFRYVDFS